MMKRFVTFLMALALLMSVSSASAVVGVDAFVADKDENYIPIPTAYEVYTTIKNLGEFDFMKGPEDIFVGPDDMLYVADTGNNRVLVMTQEGEVVEEIKTSGGKKLSKPRGVYVHDDLSVWIADTGNLRLTVLNADRTHRKDFVKPDSALLENNFTFDVDKLFVADTGYIYVLKGRNLIALDEGNNFRGYLGADDVGFSLTRTLIRMFGTKSQVERTVKQEPASYSNFFIGPDGMIYGILFNKDTAQIRKLNSVGNNTYPEEKYGFVLEDEEGKPLTPTLADITVEDNGIISVVDNLSGLIYQYDQEGNLLCTFGGLGNVGGLFQIPVSIDADSQGRLYVLDSGTGSITVFEPTNFIKLVHEAVRLHGEGRYEDALLYWRDVLEIDSNYALAHQGVAKVMGKKEQWQEALNSYYLADDKEGYSEAFGEYRHEMFRQYFVPVVATIFIGGFLLLKLLGLAKKYADKWADDVQMRRGLGRPEAPRLCLMTLFHPIVVTEHIKRQRAKRMNWMPVIVLLVLALAVRILSLYFTHYPLSGVSIRKANLLLECGKLFVPVLTWVLASYAMTTILDGETLLSETLLFSAYALVPYIVFTPILTLASRLMDGNQIALFASLEIITLGWVVLLMIIALKEMNGYSVGKTVVMILLSLFTMVMIWAVVVLLYTISSQFVGMVKEIFYEVIYRMD